MTVYRLSYYPWITQHRPLDGIHRHVESFAAELALALGNGEGVTVLPPLEIDKQIDQILADECELALMNPLGYIFARRRPGGDKVSSIAIALRIIDGTLGDTYFAQLYVRNTSALRKDDPQLPAKLRGRSIGYGVPYSTSNFLVNAFTLKQKLGINPFTHFARTEFLGGHDIAAKAVYEGRVDVGAGHDGVIIDLSNQYGYGDAREKLVQLVRSDPIPSDPVVARIADAAERTRVQKALTQAGSTAAGKAALEGFWGMAQGLEPIGADKYDMLDTIMSELNLEERDLLRTA